MALTNSCANIVFIFVLTSFLQTAIKFESDTTQQLVDQKNFAKLIGGVASSDRLFGLCVKIYLFIFKFNLLSFPVRSLELLPSNMPRRLTIYRPEPKEWFSCPVYSCSRKFRTQTGQTKHICAKHNKNELLRLSVSKMLHVPHTPHVASESDFNFLDGTNMAQSPIPNDNVPISPPPFQP